MKLKERGKLAQKYLKLPVGKFEPCDLATARFVPAGMTRAFKNNRYVVMIYDNTITTHGMAVKALIQRVDGLPIHNHWS